MLDDAFKLTLDYLYPPIKDLKVFKKAEEGSSEAAATQSEQQVGTDKNFHVDGYPDDQNLWGEPFYKFRFVN